jgi:hypothetical protein
MGKRGLGTFCDSKQWTTQAAARGAGTRRFRLLSDLRTHTKAPYKMDYHRETLRALSRPRAARTGARGPQPRDCPGQKSPFLALKRPARPYKNAIQNRFYYGKR